MQPSSNVTMNEDSARRMLGTVQRVVEARRQRATMKFRLPETIGIKLTNRCNLRCEHCYQWNELGQHRDLDVHEQARDLDIALFERLLDETRESKSRLYLWGGEPFVHRQFDRILQLLEHHRRETTICTNAHFIEHHLDGICRISDGLEFLIAVDGFEAEHDGLRGKGSFQKVTSAIHTLLGKRREGLFRGQISLHTVFTDPMMGRHYDFLDFWESQGIDLIVLCYPWYIADETSREMDQFVTEHFSWLVPGSKRRHSWDAFKYRIHPDNLQPLLEELRRINSRTWQMKVRYQPGLEFDEIAAFIRGTGQLPRCATTCRVLHSRADIVPSGDLVACKFFPEFKVGNLHEHSLAALWESETYEQIRAVFGEQLSPACSKCSVLYLQDYSSPLYL